jgi:hypothetical protein
MQKAHIYQKSISQKSISNSPNDQTKSVKFSKTNIHINNFAIGLRFLTNEIDFSMRRLRERARVVCFVNISLADTKLPLLLT